VGRQGKYCGVLRVAYPRALPGMAITRREKSASKAVNKNEITGAA